ncbi:hypothetical protein STEG23_000691 [Scotinomys teguina]
MCSKHISNTQKLHVVIFPHQTEQKKNTAMVTKVALDNSDPDVPDNTIVLNELIKNSSEIQTWQLGMDMTMDTDMTMDMDMVMVMINWYFRITDSGK